MKEASEIALLDVQGKERRWRIAPVRTLGKGRAALAVLVETEDESGVRTRCVEKIFKPGWLTRFVYWFFFQSPFPYRYCRDAILACLYRRKVAATILAEAGIGIEVAAPLYVRWDEKERAFVLGSEFIEGVGLSVDGLDERVARRFVHNYLLRPIASLFGRNLSYRAGSRSELSELMPLMVRSEKLFRRCGLVGSGWQVSTKALVSTANFIKRDSKFVLVDIESGVPSLLVPYYLFLSILKGRFPFFDDVDERRLRTYADGYVQRSIGGGGGSGEPVLPEEVEMLIEHTTRWKAGEVALFRNRFRLFMPGVVRKIKEARLDAWSKEGLIDEGGRERLERSRRFFSTAIYLAGILPGKLGRLARKLIGNTRFRRDFVLFFKNREFRSGVVRAYVEEHERRWKEEGRVPDAKTFHSAGPGFVAHLFLGRLSPRGVHRFLCDPQRRRKVAATVFFFLVSERFQTEYSKYVIFKRMREWLDDGRISQSEVDYMKERVEDGSIQEYVRGFGFHFALKFFEPVTSATKVIGTGWFLRIFIMRYPELNPHGELTLGLMKAFALTFLHNPIPVLLMINTSVYRTLITLWRMFTPRHRHISYKVALAVGIIPAFGTLAYPLQIYWRCKELSMFLVRDALSLFARSIPIYGGKHTRVEVWMVRLADFPAEFMAVMKGSLEAAKGALRLRKREAPEARSREAVAAGSNPKPGKKQGKYDRIVEEMVARVWERYEEECREGELGV